MYDFVNYKFLYFPVEIYILPVIIFLISAAASYQNAMIKFSGDNKNKYNDDEDSVPEIFEKAKPNWPLSFLVGAFFLLIIFIFDFVFSFSK